MTLTKRGLRDVVPPVLWQFARKRFSRVFSGSYTWEQAEALCGAGYSNMKAAEYALARTQQLAEQEEGPRVEPSVGNLLIALQYALAQETPGRSSAILDFGGSMGGTYFLTRKLLPPPDLAWYVVDLPATVAMARTRFENKELHFADSLVAVPDGLSAIVASSSLHYCANPYAVLESLSRKGSRFLILDRMPLTLREHDEVAIQNVTRTLYEASYPVWFLSEKNWLNALERLGWAIKFRWQCAEDAVFKNEISPYQGMFLQRPICESSSSE